MQNNLEKLWYVYMIRCKDGSLYTGITIDVERRFAEHSEQGNLCAKYLRGKAPLELVYTEEVSTHSEALQTEMRIKKLSKASKEELLKTPYHLYVS